MAFVLVWNPPSMMPLPPSDHFNGKTFFSPGEPSGRGLLDLLRWKLTSRAKPWPAQVDVVRHPLPSVPAGGGIAATWVGHATFLIRSGDLTILTDPVFSDVAGPLPWLGPRRAARTGVDFDAVPKVDLVLLSHDHYDHCDLPTLRRLAKRDDPLIVAPLGHEALLRGTGMRGVVSLDWWESIAPSPGLEITLVPARHWSRRGPFGTNRRLWGGFMLKAGGRQVYFMGDSGYQEGLFPEIRRRCGAPDLALIPIGAYEPRWFMASAHMNPEEAVRAAREVGARKSVAMHWGTFQLTDEGRDEPVQALERALEEPGAGALEFTAPPIGASVSI
jgi:L-ascorbate metabolism protein UlaG (beta-lactamase superfamily)